MRSDQCISITDLRRKTTEYIGAGVPTEQFVFVGSRPTSALLTIQRYEELKKIESAHYEMSMDIDFIPFEDLDIPQKQEFTDAIARKNSQFVDF